METIIAALIGACGSAIGALAGFVINGKLIAYRLEQLEKKVQAHNNLVERMYEVEKQQDIEAEKIQVANHRITDLEKAVEKKNYV
ncbi:MAG: hypothetical protein IJS61_03575 [Firmicutes bacterium]|nr:hypothetical protein [Bacillota bacterium]